MIKDQLIPKRRFKEFKNDEAWEQWKLGELGSVAMNKRIFKDQTSEAGDVPFYKIGTFGGTPDAYIPRGLFEEYKAKYSYPEVGDILISASGSIGRTVEYTGKDEYFQDSNIVWLKHDNRLNNLFLKQFYMIVEWEGLEGSTIKRLYNKNILETQIFVPSLSEQQRIGTFFDNLDNLITLHQRKLKKLKETKSAYLSEMFPQEGEKYPKRRFAGFTDPWEERKLGDMTPLRGGFSFQSNSFTEKGIPIIRISNILSNGTVGGNCVFYAEKDNDEDLLLPDKAAILAMSGATTGKVSILGNPNNNKIYQNQRVGYFKNIGNADYSFISTIVKSSMFTKQLKNVLVTGAQPNVSPKKINSFVFYMPNNKKEQKKIACFFKNIDNRILHQQHKLEKLENLKKAYLNEMFV